MHPEIVVGVEEVEGILDAYGVLIACRVQQGVIEEARVMHGLGSDLHLLLQIFIGYAAAVTLVG